MQGRCSRSYLVLATAWQLCGACMLHAVEPSLQYAVRDVLEDLIVLGFEFSDAAARAVKRGLEADGYPQRTGFIVDECITGYRLACELDYRRRRCAIASCRPPRELIVLQQSIACDMLIVCSVYGCVLHRAISHGIVWRAAPATRTC
jgi:hypothetical protein